MGRLSRGAAADRGAAALEFALVVPVLVALVFGMIDYGLFFSDSLGARDGVRAAARQGSVASFPPSNLCPSDYALTGNDAALNRLACLAVDQTGPIGGRAFAKVTLPNGGDAGKDIVVCVAVVENGVTGFTPMPNDSTVRASLAMRIEQDNAKDNTRIGEVAPNDVSPPAGDIWGSWCG
jgi:hypothetical protein